MNKNNEFGKIMSKQLRLRSYSPHYLVVFTTPVSPPGATLNAGEADHEDDEADRGENDDRQEQTHVGVPRLRAAACHPGGRGRHRRLHVGGHASVQRHQSDVRLWA